MGTAERVDFTGDPSVVAVSIRCREMGTAEQVDHGDPDARDDGFLFAVARWGQRNAARELTVTAVSA